MAQAKQGDTVKVHYTGKLKDGTVFDCSLERQPLEMTIGSGKIIPGVEEAVEGMSPGESKTVEISPKKGYGDHREEMVQQIDKGQFPENTEPQVGQQFQVQRQDGQPMVFTVVETQDDTVTVDANHPLAGKDLVFELELVEIE